jgi:hypothetical protein
MSRAPLLSAALFALSVSACAGATEEQLRARAAFDMSCPQGKIHLVQLDERTQGVTGCGQKGTYVETCGHVDGYGGKHDCTWVLNTDSKRIQKSEDE